MAKRRIRVKPLCVVDTSSLIHMREIEVVNKRLHRWLWDEFEVMYSAAVWGEVKRHFAKMGKDAKVLKRNGHKYVWKLNTIKAYEEALFDHEVTIRWDNETWSCNTCGRPQIQSKRFTPNLVDEKDRGERHNCCVALDAVRQGRHGQVIFLIDDFNAVRDYVEPFMSAFPMGAIWSSYDLILYLFVRHRNRFTPSAAEAALQDITANIAGSGAGGHTQQGQSRWIRVHAAYTRKVKEIEQTLNRAPGG